MGSQKWKEGTKEQKTIKEKEWEKPQNKTNKEYKKPKKKKRWMRKRRLDISQYIYY